MKTKPSGIGEKEPKWNDKLIVVGIVVGFIGVIAGALLGGVIQLLVTLSINQHQIGLDRQNVAKGLKTEIDSNKDELDVLNNGLSKIPLGGNYIFFQTIPPDNRFYSQNREIISSYNENLSTNLYKFYTSVSIANEDRTLVISVADRLSQIPDNSSQSAIFNKSQLLFDANGYTQEMKDQIHEADQLIPTLDEQLQAEINKTY